jgi:GH15 family glucan-1,4-alpha-glucosidase
LRRVPAALDQPGPDEAEARTPSLTCMERTLNTLDLALIGNSHISALVDRRGRIVWSCLPRYDGDPRFSALLAGTDSPEAGFAEIELIGLAQAQQRYRRNSAVLETELHDDKGNGLRITDLAPRFKQFARVFRPMMLIRRIQPISGLPQIRIRIRPTHDYGRRRPELTRGSNHIRYVMPDLTLRLTTDAAISHIVEEVPFLLDRELTLVLSSDESFSGDVTETARTFFVETDAYWREWCRYLGLPFEWQEAVIRAAITLKLSSFEETGAVIAAHTTSIPEAPDSGRTWDYRYCWLRDSYFVVDALTTLGVTRTMEGYLDYIMNIVAESNEGYLQPVFGIVRELRLDEYAVDSLPGYRGMGPVRVGNHAYRQVQNDAYGSVLLACAHAFLDQRLTRVGDRALFARLEILGEQARQRWREPDAGLWELRTRAAVHTYSAAMCWVALDRLAGIARHLGLRDRASYWHRHAKQVRDEILASATAPDGASLASTFGGNSVDACLLLLPKLGLLRARDPLFKGTLARVERDLRRGDFLLRYADEDDFGTPTTAFLACTFWYVNALFDVGRRREARQVFEQLLARRNPLGLFSEDVDPLTGELWGNFPQTYSMVGIIRSASRLSKRWDDAL